jgi:hypothetical protein
VVQRRGVHVNTPKRGSRDGVFSFGGIWGVYADLRRDFNLGNLKLGFFGVMFGEPRGVVRRGDQQCDFWGNLIGVISCK